MSDGTLVRRVTCADCGRVKKHVNTERPPSGWNAEYETTITPTGARKRLVRQRCRPCWKRREAGKPPTPILAVRRGFAPQTAKIVCEDCGGDCPVLNRAPTTRAEAGLMKETLGPLWWMETSGMGPAQFANTARAHDETVEHYRQRLIDALKEKP